MTSPLTKVNGKSLGTIKKGRKKAETPLPVVNTLHGLMSPRVKPPVIGPAMARLDGKSEDLGEVPPIGEIFNQQLKKVLDDSQGLAPIGNLPTCVRQPEEHPSGEVKLRTEAL